MILDLLEIDGVPEPGCLEQVPRITPQRGHLGELVPVALEVAVVHRVEPNERREQPDIRFGDGVPHQETLMGQSLLQPVQRSEEPIIGCFIGRL